MALQLVKRSTGFMKFHYLVSVYIFLIQIAFVGLVDAGRGRSWFGSLEWLCEISGPSVPLNTDIRTVETNAWGICRGNNNIYSVRGGARVEEEESSSSSVVVKNKTLNDEEKSQSSSSSLSTTTVAHEPTTTVKTTETTIVDDYSTSPYSFTVYQDNDGSQTDPDGIPTRFLKMQHHRRSNAKKALEATIKWRSDHGIDTILARPHPKFDICKKVFPHYFCGHDDTGHIILMQRPGLIDLRVGHENGLTGDDLLYHYIYTMEYLWRILEPTADSTMTSIIDLTGLNFSVLRKPELLKVAQRFCSTMDMHFPTRSHKTLLINAPRWFHAIYKILTPFLRESTRQNISILSKGKEQDNVLRSFLVECPLDEENGLPAAEVGMENEFRNFVSV